MGDQYLMALDAGSGAGRCVLVSLDGHKTFSAYQEWSFTFPAEFGMLAAEFDPDEFWKILAETSRAAMAKGGIKPEQVVAVSSTSMREGIVLLDKDGKELYAGPNRDYRAMVEGMTLTEMLGDDLYRRSGHFPAGMTGAARLVWLRENSPQLYPRICHLQSINDWILFRLCGEYACEPSGAAETSLYDLTTQEWAYDAIEKLEFPREIFPRVLMAGTQIGGVTPRAALDCGLRPGTPVVIGGADSQCGMLGCGGYRPGDIAAVSGTSTPVQMVTTTPMTDPKQRMWGGAHVVPGAFIVESNAGQSGSIYAWYRGSFCPDLVQRATETGENVYDLMNAEAEQAPVGCNGVLSYIGMLVMNARGMVMPPNTIMLGAGPLMTPKVSSRPLVTRSILESLAYAVTANTRQVYEIVEKPPLAMGVCGGLANSRLYLEALANSLQLPVYVPEIKEGTAVGAAIAAGVGCGLFASFEEGVNALVHIQLELQPEESLVNAYQAAYQNWWENFNPLLSFSMHLT